MLQTKAETDRRPGRWTRRDFDASPMIVFYELTRACDLVCLHCRARAQPKPAPGELTTAESMRLIDQLGRFPQPPTLVLTGGDPFKRPDIYDLIRHSVATGLETAITPSPTPLLTREAIARLRDAGITRMAISVDGADPATHDRMRGVPGSFDQTRRIMDDARELGIPLQINTTLNPNNFDQIEEMAEQFAERGIVLWSLFFIVPVGRATADLRLTAEQHEEAFARLYAESLRRPFGIKTTEAMHYRRYVAQQRVEARRSGGASASIPPPSFLTTGVNDGKGIMFISHVGLIHPSGFLPMYCGAFPFNDVVEVYQRLPVFRRLRRPDTLSGKCGVCEFRNLCGGSRARVYNLLGDPYASEPDCVYVPPGYVAGD